MSVPAFCEDVKGWMILILHSKKDWKRPKTVPKAVFLSNCAKQALKIVHGVPFIPDGNGTMGRNRMQTPSSILIIPGVL